MVSPIQSNITELLRLAREGNADAQAELFETVYRELRKMARRAMQAERQDHTLQPTALVHEAFMKLVGGPMSWTNRGHFFAVAATTMRRVLIDYARSYGSQKKNAGRRVDLESVLLFTQERAPDLLALDAAMSRLENANPRACRVVELQFFAGTTLVETAAILDVSTKTVRRDWKLARAWLHAEMADKSE